MCQFDSPATRGQMLLFTANVIKFSTKTSRGENKILGEPLKKRRHLVRYFTNLVPATLFSERERGDGEFLQ